LALLARRVALFHGLSADDIAKIFARGMTVRFQKGEVIFYKGTSGDQMYVVLGGKVGVYDDKQLIAHLTVGDMFGEMALIDSSPRSATVTAVEESLIFVLSETTFQRLLTKRVAIQILLNILRTLSHRLRDANTRLVHEPLP
jgi:CRP-like cAMP-binding protein